MVPVKAILGALSPRLKPNSESGLIELASFIDNDVRWSDARQLAYFLASVHHETAFTFHPIDEYTGKEGLAYYERMYGPKSRQGPKHGHTRKGDGIKYHGRGHIQLTWLDNYLKFERRLGIPLVEQPELALVPKNSYEIAATGCLFGLFTGVSFKRYINDEKCDFFNCRRVINGTDKAEEIAKQAEELLEVLRAA